MTIIKTRVIDLTALPPRTPTLVTVGGEDVFLYRSGDEVLAIGNQCPHQEESLSEGWVEGDIVTCPGHGWEFDLRSGACMTIPGERVPSWQVTVEDGAVWLESSNP